MRIVTGVATTAKMPATVAPTVRAGSATTIASSLRRRKGGFGAAAELRRAGVRLYAIGLGSDADETALRAMAGETSRYFYAPDLSDLAQIYSEIARDFVCPGVELWGQRRQESVQGRHAGPAAAGRWLHISCSSTSGISRGRGCRRVSPEEGSTRQEARQDQVDVHPSPGTYRSQAGGDFEGGTRP